MTELLDARGVKIEPGDTVIYGFGVGRSVAMAEGVVLGGECSCEQPMTSCPAHPEYGSPRLALTPTGMIRVRVVRRSYSSGEKPVVAINPDRVVVLKEASYDPWPFLPPSPLPTQDEERRQRIENLIESYTADLDATKVPDRHYYDGWTLEQFHAYAIHQLKRLREELRKLDDGA